MLRFVRGRISLKTTIMCSHQNNFQNELARDKEKGNKYLKTILNRPGLLYILFHWNFKTTQMVDSTPLHFVNAETKIQRY